jgi:hypothetical protein
MAGNTLGQRRYYLYTSDTGTEYSYLTDIDLGTAAGATLNDENPPFPRRFTPRGVFVENVTSGVKSRKFIICPATDTALYDSDASQSVTIDSLGFNTTGRKGEQASFGANP